MKLLPAFFLLAALGLRAGASPAFLLLDGIPGESIEARHAAWIEVSDFTGRVDRSPATNRATFHPLIVHKRIDRSSPLLALHVAEGRRITNGVLEAVRTAPDRATFLRMKMKGATVRSVDQEGLPDQPPTETVSFGYESLEWTYIEFSSKGKPVRSIVCAWNLLTGTGKGGEQPTDRDGDGLPDDYEELYGLNPEVDDADEDLDKDGVSNRDEFRAGTLPNKADSLFKVGGERTADGSVKLRWASRPETSYRLMGADSVQGPFRFIRRLDEAEAASGSFELPPGGQHQFFILEIE